MHCPFCNHEETKVIDSRLAGEGQQIRRRRECLQCGERFTTFETAELVMPRIVKNDASREPFDESKLRNSMLKALEKRPVSSEALDAAVVHICHKLRALGEREVNSRLVGELAMEELHNLDEVAYVRFASVYRSFQDVDAFREEIERMRNRRGKAGEGQLALWTGPEAGKTRALPEIWSKPDDFTAAQKMLSDRAPKLLAAVKAKDAPGVLAAFKEVGGACKNCHDTFRSPEEH